MQSPNPVAVQFITFCQQRCGSEWPAFYDEMCWVAGRRLFHGMGYTELSRAGISLSLYDIEKTINLVDSVCITNDRQKVSKTSR
jgi:hypothetical protein